MGSIKGLCDQRELKQEIQAKTAVPVLQSLKETYAVVRLVPLHEQVLISSNIWKMEAQLRAAQRSSPMQECRCVAHRQTAPPAATIVQNGATREWTGNLPPDETRCDGQLLSNSTAQERFDKRLELQMVQPHRGPRAHCRDVTGAAHRQAVWCSWEHAATGPRCPVVQTRVERPCETRCRC